MVDTEADPWPVVDALIRGKIKPPQRAYQPDLNAIRDSWINLDDERRALLKLLSRFALTSSQASRWFDLSKRAGGTTVYVADEEIIANPYRISEVDLGDWRDSPVSIGAIDRGLLPDATIATRHPVPEPSLVASPNDPRRIRAAIVSVLRNASINGDSLLGIAETHQAASELDLAHPCEIGMDWPTTNKRYLDGVVEILDIASDEKSGRKTSALQLSELKIREERLRSILAKRAAKSVPSTKVDWKKLLVKAISESGSRFDPKNTQHRLAIDEQAIALEQISSRRLSALVGRAGTGKTSVMGALMLCETIAKDGILLLAPTGKARVRLGKATSSEAMTVAQFLHRLGRYDGVRQRPLFTGKEKYRKEKTVVIDESSMLTMDDLAAILEALDLAHVQRLILVGDPNQLPPIGVGRPLADFVAFLETTETKADDGSPLSYALGRLTIEVRTAASDKDTSDTLRLASWFTREPQAVDADRVLSELETNGSFNDLDILFWKNPEELRLRIMDAFNKHLGVKDGADISGFDSSLGIDERGWVPFDTPDGSEHWQILSPVRMHMHGVYELNRWIQRKYRAKELREAVNPWVTSLGDENIIKKDKVIQTINQQRRAFDGSAKENYYIANGEVGLVASGKGGFLNVLFAGRPNLRFGYSGRDFPGGSGPLELAYVLTVHKAQGSEFNKVFVVLPANCRLLSRELLYTALTRSREQLVLLIEGDSATVLYDLTRP
ncbi:MAG: AAA family ATPase, partial [Cyanobacteriota bacterium]